MPELSNPYPTTTEEWEAGTSEDFKMWVLHIADEYLWSTDDNAYNFLSSLAVILGGEGWTYETPGELQEGTTWADEVVIDLRKFAVQKASEILQFDIIESNEEAEELVKAAAVIEKYILGQTIGDKNG